MKIRYNFPLEARSAQGLVVNLATSGTVHFVEQRSSFVFNGCEPALAEINGHFVIRPEGPELWNFS